MAKQINHLKRGGKPKENPRGKYNWPLEKQLFLESDYIEVKAYFENIHGVYNGNIVKNTNGWRADKIAWEKKQAEEVLKKIGQDRVRAASDALSEILRICIEDVKAIGHRRKTKSSEPLTSLWRTIRTEAGLPSSITKQENLDLNELDEARKLLDDRLKDEKTSTITQKPSARKVQRRRVSGKNKP